MSKVAYLIARNIHDGIVAAEKFKWARLGSARYAGPDKQDIRLATIPGQIVLVEHPTDVYREDGWEYLTRKIWDQTAIDSFNALVESGQIRLVNDPTQPEEEVS